MGESIIAIASFVSEMYDRGTAVVGTEGKSLVGLGGLTGVAHFLIEV
jgi:hypothetical protein